MTWIWRLEDAAGKQVAAVVSETAPVHATQSDAESWLGETWRSLAGDGVTQASLYCDGDFVYGPMPLTE